MKVANLFVYTPAVIAGEIFEPLVQTASVKLERIVSPVQTTPADAWYDQERDEWVVLISGRAGLRFEGDAEAIVLGPGDYVLIPAHRRHRVEWTAEKSVWLALHYAND